MAGAFEWHVTLRVDADRFTYLDDSAYISVIPPLPWRFLTGERITVTENDAVERCAVAPHLNESRLGVLSDEIRQPAQSGGKLFGVIG